ncbi:MAG TPA: L,D-transpeptidase family protein [Acidimicrobiales bacterium]|nr:L,D-transpeptidase family protein [Acidimicrobiales bacterium]
MHRTPRRGLTPAVAVVAVVLVATSGVLAVRKLTSSAAASTIVPVSTSLPKHLAVVYTDPAVGGGAIAPDAALSLTFNAPLAPDSPLPTVTPAVDGTWTRVTPSTIAFEPAASLPPGASVTLTVPGGKDGIQGVGVHENLASSVTDQFTVAPMSTLRVQELLAQLGYLPLTFTPISATAVPAAQLAVDQAGTFAWRWSTLPTALTSLWTQGTANVIERGAIMAFESQAGLKTDGDAGPQVWAALVAAAAAGQDDAYGHYDWVDVTTTLPEQATVWRDGSPVYTTLANTGISVAPTAAGTFPVYARFTSTTMKGFNPDGTPYSDPGIPWVSYFNGGDALHGFDRGSYGYPQSLGCVEMPPANAGVVFPYTPIGTLVTVQ